MADIKAVDFYGNAKKVFAKSEYDKGYNQALEDVQKEFDSYCKYTSKCTKNMNCLQCTVDKLKKGR